MTGRTRFVRFIAGFVLVAAILTVAFALILPWETTWGAMDSEVAGAYPGDEVIATAGGLSTNALTINASPDQVWPWIAQMGESRGGFYSYMFIENLFVSGRRYNNANRIIPELQNPTPGTPIIGEAMSIRAVEPGRWMLGSAPADGVLKWTWLWHITPTGNGQTRLVVRTKIQAPPEMSNPVFNFVMNAGSFVMGRKMMEGLKLHAEGGIERPYEQSIEIVLWFAAFAVGIAAAVFFLIRRRWLPSLAVGIAAVLVLLAFTYLQPALWLRGVLDLGLLAGVWWAKRMK